MLTGPKISSGVENRDMRYSKERALAKASFSLLAIIDFATPGGPSSKMLSPERAASSARLISVCLSYIFSESECRMSVIRAWISDIFVDVEEGDANEYDKITQLKQ